MRLALLLATGLEAQYSPPFNSKDSNKRALAQGMKRDTTAGLLSSSNIAQHLCSEYGTEVSDRKISSGIKRDPSSKVLYERSNLKWRMIIVDPVDNAVYVIVSLLQVDTDGSKITRAIPYVKVSRYGLPSGKTRFRNFPSLSSEKPREDDDDLDMDSFIEKFTSLDISKSK